MSMTKYSQPPLRITVLAIKHRSAKCAALQTLNRQCCQTHRQITVRFENRSRGRGNTLEKTRWASSISISLLRFLIIISSFWPPNYIGLEEKAVTANREKLFRSVKITPRKRRDVNTIAVNHPQNRMHAAKNNYRRRQWPMHRWVLHKNSHWR